MVKPSESPEPLTQARLKEVLNYAPETGVFTWLVALSGCVHIGEVAGTSTTLRHWVIGIDFKRYSAHRLAFLYMTGKWPEQEVNHANGDKSDNRWGNLRPASHGKCMHAAKVLHPRNTSGFKGVSFNREMGNWVAGICINSERIHLGYYLRAERAAAAYDKAAIEHYGDFAKTNKSLGLL